MHLASVPLRVYAVTEISDLEMSLMRKLIEMKEEFDQLTALLVRSEDKLSLAETKLTNISVPKMLLEGRQLERDYILNAWKTSMCTAEEFLKRYKKSLSIEFQKSEEAK